MLGVQDGTLTLTRKENKMKQTIFNKDFVLTQKAHVKSFYCTTWKWLNVSAFTHSPDGFKFYNLVLGKIVLSLVVKK